MTVLKHSRQILSALSLFLICTILLFYACKKETQPEEFIAKPFSLEQASSRTPFEITTIGWLDTFQNNLALAVANTSLTQTYTFTNQRIIRNQFYFETNFFPISR